MQRQTQVLWYVESRLACTNCSHLLSIFPIPKPVQKPSHQIARFRPDREVPERGQSLETGIGQREGRPYPTNPVENVVDPAFFKYARRSRHPRPQKKLLAHRQRGAFPGGAEPLLREALAMGRRVLHAEHPDVGFSCNNMALLLSDKGEVAAAEPLFREGMAILEKALEPDHPNGCHISLPSHPSGSR